MRSSEWRRRGAGGGLQTFDGQVSAGGDDGYVIHELDNIYAAGATTYLGQDALSRGFSTWAFFGNVTIPGGATVTAAYIEVQSNNSGPDGVGVKTTIYFEDVANGVNPVSEDDFVGKAKTAASVAWDDEDFVINTYTASPDLSAILQEILDRGDWNSGQDMLLLWFDRTSTDAMSYQLYTYEGDSIRVIKLHVEYTT